jgi:hypothetical protein
MKDMLNNSQKKRAKQANNYLQFFVDFIKAFDTLEWDFMLNTLKHFGFNDSFIRWVQTLYSDIQTCVSNNGWVSEIFNNPRGIRQRCPLSALLFILSVQSMSFRRRSNNNIKGIAIKIDEKKIIVYKFRNLLMHHYQLHRESVLLKRNPQLILLLKRLL